jgi:cyclic pyranopterin phosphate synthase
MTPVRQGRQADGASEKGLVDPHGRRIRKLRVALTEACNFRCSYCMPDAPAFRPYSELLRPDSLVRICGRLVELGITRIRITGGEPTLRPDFETIVEGLSALPVERLGLTTNGCMLAELLPFLAGTRCRYINVSLDSLRPLRFQAITRSDRFEAVRRGLLQARERGLRVKVNTVVSRGVNDDELADFVEFSAANQLPVRFLELMRVGPRLAEHHRRFVPAAEMIDRLGRRYPLTPKATPPDSTSFDFVTDHGAEIGFIASESRPFCGACSRLRLTATGRLRACMMTDRGAALASLPMEAYPATVARVMAMKPGGRIDSTPEGMYQIGG